MPAYQDILTAGSRQAEDVQKGHMTRVHRVRALLAIDFVHKYKEMYTSALFWVPYRMALHLFFYPSSSGIALTCRPIMQERSSKSLQLTFPFCRCAH